MAVDIPRLSNLLRPLALRKQLLKNRIVFAPVSTRLVGCKGSISPQMLAYYANIASGGAAAVVTETLHIDDVASKFTVVQPAIHHDRFLPGLSTLSDEIRNCGTLPIAQIGHAGRQTSYEANNRVPVAPSSIPGLTRGCHVLINEGISSIIRAFAAAAQRAVSAGFDGVEIYGGNGYLINEFLSLYTNQTQTRFLRLAEDGVITDRHSMPLAADLVIVALGSSNNTMLKCRIDSNHWQYGVNYLPVGDAHRVGKIYEAVHDSYWRVSSLLDKIR